MNGNLRFQARRTACIVRSISWQDEGIFARALDFLGHDARHFDALATGELSRREPDRDSGIVLGGPNGPDDTTLRRTVQ